MHDHSIKHEITLMLSISPLKFMKSMIQLYLLALGLLMINSQTILAETVPTKPVPKISCKRAIVVDYATGKVLYAKNAMDRCTIASLQKMLTALCIQERGNTSKVFTIKSTDTNVVPSKIYVKPGDKYSRSALVKALLVKSGNDIAKALARDAAGSSVNFAVMMNSKAKKIGMMHSNFKNPHGLTESGQYSCAYDAAILARVAFHDQTLRSYMSTKQYTFTYYNGTKKTFTNTNKVLKSLSYCNGLKTGTTNASGRCLASSGTLNGRTAIVICLGGDSNSVWKDSTALLRWSLERPATSL